MDVQDSKQPGGNSTGGNPSPTSTDGAKQRFSVAGLLTTLGPGLVTGASDDDPSGIATYSQVGAQFGFGMLWTMLFSYPLMCAIQVISARVGSVTGRGIAGNLRRYYSRPVLYVIVLLLLLANTINLGSDIGAMGQALALVIGGPSLVYAALFSLASLGLEIFSSYAQYSRVLKWLCAVLLAYVATAFAIHVPWLRVIEATIIPSFQWNTTYITSFIAVLGTTISPYLFFWQAEDEVELVGSTPGGRPIEAAPQEAQAQFSRIRTDTLTGMAFSNIVAFFIMLTAGATLHAHGITNISTSTQAAEALRPIGGRFAFLLFALGIVGTGLLAVPVLGGSSAYAVGEALEWPVGLARKPLQAKGFYGILAASTLIGLCLNFLHVNAVKALFWTAVINGVVAVPIMALMMVMSQNPKVMGPFTLRPALRIVGWLATAVMLAAAIGLFATWGK